MVDGLGTDEPVAARDRDYVAAISAEPDAVGEARVSRSVQRMGAIGRGLKQEDGEKKQATRAQMTKEILEHCPSDGRTRR